MDYQELILKRHSVRKFTDQDVPRELLDCLIDDALTAPSSKNTKSSCFMIVQEPDVLDAIAQMRDSGSAFVNGAKAAVVVMGDSSKSDMWDVNSSISATYILLSAVDKGLGACWVHVKGRPRDKKNPAGESAESYLKNLLGIENENLHVMCVVALGYEAL